MKKDKTQKAAFDKNGKKIIAFSGTSLHTGYNKRQ